MIPKREITITGQDQSKVRFWMADEQDATIKNATTSSEVKKQGLGWDVYAMLNTQQTPASITLSVNGKTTMHVKEEWFVNNNPVTETYVFLGKELDVPIYCYPPQSPPLMFSMSVEPYNPVVTGSINEIEEFESLHGSVCYVQMPDNDKGVFNNPFRIQTSARQVDLDIKQPGVQEKEAIHHLCDLAKKNLANTRIWYRSEIGNLKGHVGKQEAIRDILYQKKFL